MPTKILRITAMSLAVTAACLASYTLADTNSIPEIVVSASASEQELRDAPAAMSLITREQLLQRPVRDILDAVRESPGVTMTSASFTRKRINIRGMDNTHTLFLVDGRRVNASADVIAHSDFELGWIPSEAIQQVELVRGPLSALYGSEALGGVINVITRPVTDRWTGSAQISYGDLAGAGGTDQQLGGYMAGPIVEGKLGLRVYVDHQDRDITPDPADKNISAIEGRRASSGGATLSWTPAQQHRIDVSIQRANDLRRRDTRTPGPIARSVVYEFRDDVERQQIDAHYNGDFGSYQVELGAYRSTLDRVNFQSKGRAPSAPSALTDDILEGRVRFNRGSHTLLIGAETRGEELKDGSLINSGVESADTRALIAQDTISLPWESMTLTLGLRADRHEQFGAAYSPRAYLVYHANDILTLRGGFGRGFKAPTLKQLSTQFSAFGGGGRFEITGNPDLNPEKSRSAEFGVLARVESIKAEFTVFENRLDDLVQTSCFSRCGVFGLERRNYVNVSEAQIRGFESGAQVTLPAGFEFALNYTYIDSKDISTDLQLLERPRHSANSRLGWNMGNWSAQLRAQRVGSQTSLVGAARVELPHYTLWHTSVSYDVKPQWTLRAGVENLGDEKLKDNSVNFTYEERGRYAYVTTNLNF